jgi:hypothetical protein
LRLFLRCHVIDVRPFSRVNSVGVQIVLVAEQNLAGDLFREACNDSLLFSLARCRRCIDSNAMGGSYKDFG